MGGLQAFLNSGSPDVNRGTGTYTASGRGKRVLASGEAAPCAEGCGNDSGVGGRATASGGAGLAGSDDGACARGDSERHVCRGDRQK
mmetsp:Transcript_24589/g.43788  ORF Transcript_24589/g.43788 Transcript_24589/m.43788 type:complete len:87 (-) Transcript_24589:82-342(-)